MLSSFLVCAYGLLSEGQKGWGEVGGGGSACGAIYNIRLLGYIWDYKYLYMYHSGVSCLY
jgi:hypothetical protein